MNQFQTFKFISYDFNPATKVLDLKYGLDDHYQFSEHYLFNFNFSDYSQIDLDYALNLLFLLAGVSYYKTYLPPTIDLGPAKVDESLASFLSKTYRKGLAELFYVNQLDPNYLINFKANIDHFEIATKSSKPLPSGQLVGLGGGKDSLLAIELLRPKVSKLASFSLDHQEQLQPLVQQVGLKHYSVQRTWDKQLLELNMQGAYNGHIPISAIIAATGLVSAILSGYADIVVANEYSANEATLIYQGLEINHQYSKSTEFENDFSQILSSFYGTKYRYYSLLRPLSELKIAELFANLGFMKYRFNYSSCNRAFRHDQRDLFWCTECSKCAFNYLILAPFVAEKDLMTTFNNQNLLLKSSLEPIYRQLLGISGHKPLDCVGEVRESRLAMSWLKQRYPSLNKYNFELDKSYNYNSLNPSNVPREFLDLFS